MITQTAAGTDVNHNRGIGWIPATPDRLKDHCRWGRHRFQDFEVAAVALRDWETRYNFERFSLALQGRTPAEKLAALQPPRQVA
jgi:transposase InsO family protein